METVVVPADALVALADLADYRSFVAADWTLSQLRAHFATEAARGAMVAWGVGESGNWRIAVARERGPGGFREFAAPIRATGRQLHLVGYDELTMAAQFPDVRLPEPHGGAWPVAVAPGWYECRVVQLYDPALADSPEVFHQQTPHFRLELLPAGGGRPGAGPGVPWFPHGE